MGRRRESTLEVSSHDKEERTEQKFRCRGKNSVAKKRVDVFNSKSQVSCA